MSVASRRRVDELWEGYLREAKANGGNLFDGPVTLLRSARMEDGKVILELGPGQFKDFVVTVCRDRDWFLKHEPDALRPTLGNSMLLTHKGAAMLGVRSDRVSAYARRAHLVGGMMERLGTERFPASIVGILKHLRLELSEEAALETRELAPEPRLLGVVRDEILGQPDLVWQWETRIPLEEVAGRLDREEHTAAVLLGKSDIPPGTWEQMTPVARTAWTLWRTLPGVAV
jgi:hypothetical protein